MSMTTMMQYPANLSSTLPSRNAWK